MAVVTYHVYRYFPQATSAGWLIGFGYSGVSFFFVLSGFVLAWSSRESDAKGAFYWRRFARVWPLHLLTTILAAAVALVVGRATHWTALPMVLTLTQSWPPNEWRYAFNSVSWSLSCEAFFYALFPFLFTYLSGRGSLKKLAAVVAVVMIAVGGLVLLVAPAKAFGYLLYTMPAYRLGEFVLGVTLAIVIRKGWRPEFKLSHAYIGTAAIYAALMLATVSSGLHPEELPYVIANLALVPGFLAIIAATATSDLSGQTCFLSGPRLVRLGQWSFALYLVHELVIKATVPIIGMLTGPVAYFGIFAVVVSSIALSGLLFEFFEKPIERTLRLWRSERAVVQRR